MSAGRGSINVTPLIDVLLVLLIIFLVMMPLMAKLETVDLPPQQAEDTQVEAPPLILELKADLTIAIDEGPPQPSSDLSQIRPRLTHGKHVFVDAESSVPWDEVVGLIDRVRGLAPSYDAVQVAVRIRQAAE